MRALGFRLLMLATPALSKEVGVDWTGNDIVIKAIPDPKAAGVTSHIAYFDRSVLDRLSNANWSEDPSNSSIPCRQTGPLSLGDIDTSPQGEDVFIWSTSLIFKSLNVTRIFDQKTQVLIYLTCTNDLTQGSAKMSICTVPRYGTTKSLGLTQKLARNLAQVMRQFDGF